MQPFIAEKREEIAELCRKHHVRRLSVFGSAVREDFDPERSDVDVLVAFTSLEFPGYTANLTSLRSGLESLWGREVDLIREGVIRNQYRLKSIEADKVEIYAT
jgi:predicted nucleotidyltransferase